MVHDGGAKISRPALVLNFTRVETFGDRDVHRVRASVDTRDPEVFWLQPEIVKENATP
jgi:hypothetical protein